MWNHPGEWLAAEWSLNGRSGAGTATCDLVIRRVQEFDGCMALPGLRDLSTKDGKSAAVSQTPLSGRRQVDADGRSSCRG